MRGASGSPPPQASQYQLPPGPQEKRGGGDRTEPPTQQGHFEERGSAAPIQLPHALPQLRPQNLSSKFPGSVSFNYTDQNSTWKTQGANPTRESGNGPKRGYKLHEHRSSDRRPGAAALESETARRAWQPDPARGLAHPPWVGSAVLPAGKRVLRTTLSGSQPLLSPRACGGDHTWRGLEGTTGTSRNHSQARARG